MVEPDDRFDLADLRAAWREVEPPAAKDELDAETAQAVDWMRAAWEQVEAPPLPMALVRRQRRTSPTASVLLTVAAAAIVLVAMRFLAGNAVDEPRPATQTANRTGGEEIEQPGGTIPPGLNDEVPTLVAVTSDRIEMRQGTVRLILLRQGEGADGPTSGN